MTLILKRSGVKISQKLLLFLDIRHHAAVLDQFGDSGFRVCLKIFQNERIIILGEIDCFLLQHHQ